MTVEPPISLELFLSKLLHEADIFFLFCLYFCIQRQLFQYSVNTWPSSSEEGAQDRACALVRASKQKGSTVRASRANVLVFMRVSENTLLSHQTLLSLEQLQPADRTTYGGRQKMTAQSRGEQRFLSEGKYAHGQ